MPGVWVQPLVQEHTVDVSFTHQCFSPSLSPSPSLSLKIKSKKFFVVHLVKQEHHPLLYLFPQAVHSGYEGGGTLYLSLI